MARRHKKKTYKHCKCACCGVVFEDCECGPHRFCGPRGMGCGQPMWFVLMENGKRMPVNRNGTCHFKVCRYAKK